MVSPSCEVFVSGVDDEKMMAYLEEFDINADAILSDSKSDAFSSDSSEGIVLDTPPKFLKMLVICPFLILLTKRFSNDCTGSCNKTSPQLIVGDYTEYFFVIFSCIIIA